jgi:hypothetical protein
MSHVEEEPKEKILIEIKSWEVQKFTFTFELSSLL